MWKKRNLWVTFWKLSILILETEEWLTMSLNPEAEAGVNHFRNIFMRTFEREK